MRDNEKREFIALMHTVAEYYDRKLAIETVGIYWRGLADLPFTTVKAALEAHAQDPVAGQYMPKIADVRRQVAAHADDGHPGPEEAWSIALQARHESASVVWTEEMSRAFFQAALPLLDEGDKIAARKAFQERYEREVEQARRDGRPARWAASFGSDPEGRVRAFDQAVTAGRLPADYARSVAPQLEAPKPTVAALLAAAAAPSADVDAKAALAKLRLMVGGRHAA